MPDARPSRSTTPTVLLVTGQVLEGRLTARVLELDGMTVYMAKDHAEVGQYIESKLRFDAAVIDVDVEDGTGWEVVWRMHGLTPPVNTVTYGANTDAATVREAFLFGIHGCLRKPVDPELLRAAVRRAVDGSRLVANCLARVADVPRTEDASIPRPIHGARMELTPREEEVLHLLLSGKRNFEMAAQLQVSQRTVKYHVQNVLKKVGADSRVTLLASFGRALESGEI